MRRFALLLLMLCCALAARAAPALRATDDRGVTVELAGPPQRIVSLLPSLTEAVCALGQCGRLVGVDRYSTHPGSLRGLPRVGGGIDPNIEAIAALKPDLVLLSVSSRAGERLEALGVKAFALEAQTYDDVRRVFERVGALLGVDDAPRVWARTEAGVGEAARSLPPQARGLNVYFEVSNGPYAAGEASFIGETMRRLGVRNIVPAALGPFPKLNPEYIVRADPDLIIVSEHNPFRVDQRPGWSGLRAVREGRICVLSAEQTDVAVRPGPRMDEGARILAGCIAGKGPGPAEAGR